MLDRIYGALGTVHSPIGNNEIAQTITRHGKFCNISASKYINNCFKKLFGINDDYVTICSGDTGSIFRGTVLWIK